MNEWFILVKCIRSKAVQRLRVDYAPTSVQNSSICTASKRLRRFRCRRRDHRAWCDAALRAFVTNRISTTIFASALSIQNCLGFYFSKIRPIFELVRENNWPKTKIPDFSSYVSLDLDEWESNVDQNRQRRDLHNHFMSLSNAQSYIDSEMTLFARNIRIGLIVRKHLWIM